MRLLPVLPVLLALLGAGCTRFPDLDGAAAVAAQAAPWPVLVPLDPLLAQGAAITITPAVASDLDARAAALRARAARLRARPVGAAG